MIRVVIMFVLVTVTMAASLPSKEGSYQDVKNEAYKFYETDEVNDSDMIVEENEAFHRRFLEESRNICVYHGTVYHQNDTWQDGCKYKCRCFQNGIFRCTEICPSYKSPLFSCQLLDPLPGTCCKRVICPFIPPNGSRDVSLIQQDNQ